MSHTAAASPAGRPDPIRRCYDPLQPQRVGVTLLQDPGAARSVSTKNRRRFPVNNAARRLKIMVSADGKGLVSQTGVLTLLETLWITGSEPGPGGRAGPVARAADSA
jgi:hypothetical protein